MYSRYQITYYPSTLTRANSCLDLKDLATEETTRFHPQEVVGSGTYGYVRRFSNGETDLAVKAPNRQYEYSVTEKEVEYRRLRLEAEFSLASQANPENNILYMTEVLGLDKRNANQDAPKFHYSWRIVDEFHPGETLENFLDDHTFVSAADFGLLLLRIAQALEKVHANQVIHGDIAGRNIMIEKKDTDYSVKFIDFGLGYKLNGNAVSGFYDVDDYCEIAPERINRKRLPADRAQDVYSLAILTSNILQKNFRTTGRKECKRLLPCISEFIDLGKRKNPIERPDLSVFIRKLRHQLEWRDLDINLYKLAVALEHAEEDGYSTARKLTEGYQSQYTGERLAELFAYLIENNKFTVASNLLAFKKVPISFYTLYDIVMNPQTPTSFLDEAISRIPHKERDDILTATNFDKSTLLHTAASNGRLDQVFSLLDHQLNLLAEDSDKHKPVDVATDDIKPVMQLLTWIAKRQQQHQGQRAKLFHGRGVDKELIAATKMLDVAQGKAEKNELADHLETINNCKELSGMYAQLVEKSFMEGLLASAYEYFKSFSITY